MYCKSCRERLKTITVCFNKWVFSVMYAICEYQADWPLRFERICSYLNSHLNSECLLHHIGSTSIPGMPGKDIIDISVEYPRGLKPKILKVLKQAGYHHLGDLGLSGRDAFKADSSYTLNLLPPHHLYACERGAYELKKHLAFRDYLRANPQRALWLANMKRLAASESACKNEYIEKKSAFYELMTAESMQ